MYWTFEYSNTLKKWLKFVNNNFLFMSSERARTIHDYLVIRTRQAQWIYFILIYTFTCTYRVSNYRLGLLYALVCKGHACHILFSNIILKFRHETNCWSWFWVYKFDQKWKILKIQKKIFFFNIFLKIFFHFLKFFGSLVCLILWKRANFKYLIWFKHTKLSKNLKKRK